MNTTKLRAFHNDPAVKEKYIARVKAHAAADEIIKGRYWEDGKGCAVGCTVHSDDHSAYEAELGLPTWLARLEDKCFEGMPNDQAKEFPLKFLEAIPVGADLEPVKAKFFHWLLVDETYGVKRFSKSHSTAQAIQAVADLYEKINNGETVKQEQWQEAKSACWKEYTACATYTAVVYTAYAAAYTYADVVDSAVTADAAYAAAAYADAAAAYAADAYADAAYAAAAYAAARRNHYARMADKLIELLEQVK